MQQQLEIEHKFLVPHDIESLLHSAYAKLTAECEFSDDYYDSNDFKLCLEDTWLRKRNDKWQLKYPPGPSTGCPAAEGICQYYETENQSEIVTILCKTLSISAVNTNVEDLVQSYGLHVFVSFVTHRKEYTVQDLTLVLDKTNSGYCIGEVELIVSDPSKSIHAKHKIEDFMKKFNLKIASKTEGKLQHYLSQHNHKLLAKLKQASIL